MFADACGIEPRALSRRERLRESEERLDRVENSRAFGRFTGFARDLVGVLVDVEKLHSSRGELLGELDRNLGAREQNALEGRFVESVALDVRERDDVCRTRRSGHEPHLAEVIGRRELSHLPRHRRRRPTAVGIDRRADLGSSRCHDVKVMGDRALPRHDLALDERRGAEAVGQRAQLLFAE